MGIYKWLSAQSVLIRKTKVGGRKKGREGGSEKGKEGGRVGGRKDNELQLAAGEYFRCKITVIVGNTKDALSLRDEGGGDLKENTNNDDEGGDS